MGRFAAARSRRDAECGTEPVAGPSAERSPRCGYRGGTRVDRPPGSGKCMAGHRGGLQRHRSGRGGRAAGDGTGAWGHASVAAVIGGRPFLQADEAPWIEGQRQRLRSVLVRALQCLSSLSGRAGELSAAIQYADRIIEIEPCREAVYQEVMRLHVRMGNAAEALRLFEKCRFRLATSWAPALPQPRRGCICPSSAVKSSSEELVLASQPRTSR